MEDYKCETIKMINWRESLAQSSKKGRLIQYLEGQIVLVAINIGLDFVKKKSSEVKCTKCDESSFLQQIPIV